VVKRQVLKEENVSKVFYVLKGYDNETVICRDESIAMIKEVFRLERKHNPHNYDFYHLYLYDNETNVCLDGLCGTYWEIYKEIETLFVRELSKEQ
jgi:hypothetical protein